MAKLEKLIEDLEEEDFPAAIQKVNVFMYDLLEAQQEKSGGGKVTKEIMKVIKKGMDYISLRLVKAHKQCVSNEERLRTMITDSKAYDALMKKRSGTSESISSRLGEHSMIRKIPKEDAGFSVLVTPKEGTAMDVKQDLRQIAKEVVDFPQLSDVVMTKTGQLVLKVKSKVDSERLVKTMAPLGDKVRISSPRRRRSRILLLSLDKDIDQDRILRSVRGLLVDAGLDGDRELEVVRKVNTRAGQVNWILDVDREAFTCMIDRKRICIDLERYRIVEYLQIVRCFKCQAYGHMVSRCSGTLTCRKCSGSHHITDCVSAVESCANCQKQDDSHDSAHSADSPDCPCFKAYRDELLARRL